MKFKSMCMIFRILLLFSPQGSLSLRNVYMAIPEATERGKPVAIKCMYDLENEDLYQVKWYRGDREFYRYSPRDRDESDAMRLTIKAATQEVNGRYTCEVSADAPSFLTAQVHGTLRVVDLPKGDPELNGLKPSYRPGMKLKAECITCGPPTVQYRVTRSRL
ncbi:unnamed protein product [Leptidea sinapis]|uniref:Ig-like domain-containing protein n=1 Tax=Leptidea sinapis TaxID=189913 RepID=A0A5E4R0C2_9NEOP|nr:unnamed protein product [Leptidea sinapis]